jgi:hypothetical protein
MDSFDLCMCVCVCVPERDTKRVKCTKHSSHRQRKAEGEKKGEESRVLRKEWEETKERSSDA